MSTDQSTTDHDDSDRSKLIELFIDMTGRAVRGHQARVRLIAASLARQIDAIPADASILSRRARLGHIKKRTSEFAYSFYREPVGESWWLASREAWQQVRRAMELNVPLTDLFSIES